MSQVGVMVCALKIHGIVYLQNPCSRGWHQYPCSLLVNLGSLAWISPRTFPGRPWAAEPWNLNSKRLASSRRSPPTLGSCHYFYTFSSRIISCSIFTLQRPTTTFQAPEKPFSTAAVTFCDLLDSQSSSPNFVAFSPGWSASPGAQRRNRDPKPHRSQCRPPNLRLRPLRVCSGSQTVRLNPIPEYTRVKSTPLIWNILKP